LLQIEVATAYFTVFLVYFNIMWLGNTKRAMTGVSSSFFTKCVVPLSPLAACLVLAVCFAPGTQASDKTTMAFIHAVLRFQSPAAPVSAFLCWQPGNSDRSAGLP
jgi:hypothetical protein